MPPNGFEQCLMSCKVRSRASKASLFVMVASSQKMTEHSFRRQALEEPRLMLHIGKSVVERLSGMLNVECAVLPFESSWAAIPLLATASATNPLDRRRARHRLIR
jgi:hypothetical protein